MKKNKVLWFDDEHESLIKLKREALSIPYHIELVGFKSNEEGMKELRENFHQYNAILLDARFYLKENERGNGGIQALMKTKEDLDRFRAKRFKYFVLTGQADLTKENSWFDTVFPMYYDKGDPDSLDQLWKDLKLACHEDSDYQVKTQYQKVFDSLIVFSRIHPEEIFEIIKACDSSDQDVVPQDFTTLRTVLERIREHYNDRGYLPEALNRKGLNAAIRFLSGNDYKYILHHELFDPTMSDMATYLNNVLQDATHMTDEISLKVKEHINEVESRYLYRSCVNQLFELMVYTDQFFNKGIEPGQWELKAVNIDVLTGTIEKDSEGFIHCGNCSINPNILNNLNIKVGMEVKITQTAVNTFSKTKEKYPLFAVRIESL